MLNNIQAINPNNTGGSKLSHIFTRAAFYLTRSDNPTFRLLADLTIFPFGYPIVSSDTINSLKEYIKMNGETTDPLVLGTCIIIAKKIMHNALYTGPAQDAIDLANFILSHSDFFEETELISARSQREKILRIENRERQKIRERQKADSTRQSNEQIGQSLNSW